MDVDGPLGGRILAGAEPLGPGIGVAWGSVAAGGLRGCGLSVLQGSPHPSPGIHACDHLWAPILPLFGPRDRDPAIAPEPAALAATRARFGEPPIVISPGSGGARKRWPIALWHDVAAQIGGPAVWISGPIEGGEEGWGSPRWSPDLPELVALASRCRAFLAPDSGPAWVAAAAGARTGALFAGPTDPGIWAPPGATVFAGMALNPEKIAEWALCSP